jgi:hypothetical protein
MGRARNDPEERTRPPRTTALPRVPGMGGTCCPCAARLPVARAHVAPEAPRRRAACTACRSARHSTTSSAIHPATACASSARAPTTTRRGLAATHPQRAHRPAGHRTARQGSAAHRRRHGYDRPSAHRPIQRPSAPRPSPMHLTHRPGPARANGDDRAGSGPAPLSRAGRAGSEVRPSPPSARAPRCGAHGTTDSTCPRHTHRRPDTRHDPSCGRQGLMRACTVPVDAPRPAPSVRPARHVCGHGVRAALRKRDRVRKPIEDLFDCRFTEFPAYVGGNAADLRRRALPPASSQARTVDHPKE